MHKKKQAAARGVNDLLADIRAATAKGEDLRTAIRDLLSHAGRKTAARSVLLNFRKHVAALHSCGFTLSDSEGPEVKFEHPYFVDHEIALAPQPDGSTQWSHFSPSGTVYSQGAGTFQSLKKLLGDTFGKSAGFSHRAGRRVIHLGATCDDANGQPRRNRSAGEGNAST